MCLDFLEQVLASSSCNVMKRMICRFQLFPVFQHDRNVERDAKEKTERQSRLLAMGKEIIVYL